jgi:hypothetical protein
MAIVTRYVNSTTGNDSNDGLSVGASKLTIQSAITAFGGGNTDVAVIRLTGTFTPSSLSVPWSLGTASLELRGGTINLTGPVSMFASSYSYVRLSGITLTNVGSNRITLSNYCLIDGCDITGGGPTNYAIVLGGQSKIAECVFRDCGWSLAAGSAISHCEHYGVQVYSNVNHGCSITHCRFVNHTLGWSNAYGATIANCSFFGNSNSAKQLYGDRLINGCVTDCVFASSTNGLDPSTAQSSGVYCRNYYYAVTNPVLNSSSIVDYTAPTLLTSAPYADPANEDWTLSSELAAIISTNGLTPGAAQSSGGGTSRPSIPFLQQVIG